MSRITTFYQLAGTDSEGRMLEELWQMSDEELMHHHDVIQWLFPLDKESSFNPDAPVLTAKDIQIFQKSDELRSHLETSFYRFMKVVGVTCEKGDDGKLHRLVFLPSSKLTYVWSTPNHNWLRFTRIIRSLTILGNPELARTFLQFCEENVVVPEAKESLEYWRKASL